MKQSLQFISKSQLALEAGISPRTLTRYLHTRRDALRKMGISPKAQKLPRHAVAYLSQEFCFDLQ